MKTSNGGNGKSSATGSITYSAKNQAIKLLFLFEIKERFI